MKESFVDKEEDSIPIYRHPIQLWNAIVYSTQKYLYWLYLLERLPGAKVGFTRQEGSVEFQQRSRTKFEQALLSIKKSAAKREKKESKSE